jgi:putative phage-type endonuclease
MRGHAGFCVGKDCPACEQLAEEVHDRVEDRRRVGLSTYESPFSLWHRMAGLIPPDDDNDQKRRGHYLEPAIRAWFADQHPNWHVFTTGTWVHDERPWQAASPDALVYTEASADDGATQELRVAEFKSAHEDDDWGEPGSDDIPVGYRCQVMWQMDVLGVEVCHVVALTRHLEFVEYVVHYDEAEAELLREAGSDFMTSLAKDEPPDIDAHGETYRRSASCTP